MFNVCTKVCAGCIDCQRLKKAPLPLPLLPTNKFTLPFRCWALDFLPRLPITPDGFNHILLCVDPFSKWVELIPARTKSSEEVAKALELHIFARFGLPMELRVDRGLEFAGKVKELCNKLNIKWVSISTQNPQANGQAERYVGVVKKTLITMLSEDGRFYQEW